jgi:hypothetical protein
MYMTAILTALTAITEAKSSMPRTTAEQRMSCGSSF